MVRSASELVRTHVNSWIKTEPNLILIQNLNPVPPDNPTTCTTLTTEEFGGPLGLEINAVNTGIKSKEAHVSEMLYILLLNYVYRTRAIITRSWSETALVYKPRILGLKNEEF